MIAGESQPPAVHALGHAINQALGSVGTTVSYTRAGRGRARSTRRRRSRELVADMDAGQVELLVILGGNPVYDAPADLDFAAALDKVPLRVHLGLYDDETAERCHWHVPAAHALESWGDARASDGTVDDLQPLIAPLYGGKSAHELLAAFAERPEQQRLRARARALAASELGAATSRRAGSRALHDGVVAGTALADEVGRRSAPGAVDRRRAAGAPRQRARARRSAPTRASATAASPTTAGCRSCRKPLTKLTWDNAALVSPRPRPSSAASRPSRPRSGHVTERRRAHATAAARSRRRSGSLPGHADGVVTVHLGYGRTRAGRVGTGVGFNAYALRTSDAPWFGAGLRGRARPASATRSPAPRTTGASTDRAPAAASGTWCGP